MAPLEDAVQREETASARTSTGRAPPSRRIDTPAGPLGHRAGAVGADGDAAAGADEGRAGRRGAVGQGDRLLHQRAGGDERLGAQHAERGLGVARRRPGLPVVGGADAARGRRAAPAQGERGRGAEACDVSPRRGRRRAPPARRRRRSRARLGAGRRPAVTTAPPRVGGVVGRAGGARGGRAVGQDGGGCVRSPARRAAQGAGTTGATAGGRGDTVGAACAARGGTGRGRDGGAAVGGSASSTEPAAGAARRTATSAAARTRPTGVRRTARAGHGPRPARRGGRSGSPPPGPVWLVFFQSRRPRRMRGEGHQTAICSRYA